MINKRKCVFTFWLNESLPFIVWDNTFLDNIDSQLGILEDQLSKFSLRFICELDGGNFSTSEGGGIKMVKERGN